MSGKTDKGYKLGKKLFNDFELTSKGKELKKRDYYTWAVWRSGIVVRTIDAFISKKLNFDKAEFKGWIKTAEKDLQCSDFGYRVAEFISVKQKLRGN